VAVALRVASARARPHASRLRADAARLLGAMGLRRAELSIIIVDDATIQGLNREFRGKDAPTDVLSFSQMEEIGAAPPDPLKLVDKPGMILGDVVISIETALKQASRHKVSPAMRLQTLLIHGVLHLVGYDHERSRADARKMFARERELASAIGKKRGAGKRTGR
jgi:probable rRNA maturation factor